MPESRRAPVRRGNGKELATKVTTKGMTTKSEEEKAEFLIKAVYKSLTDELK